MKQTKVSRYVVIGMLSAVSYVLMLLDFPLPGFPSFLKIDFSDIPALLGAIVMGPGTGVLIELFKNMIDVLTTGSETGVPVGHLANFATGTTFILTAYFIYSHVKSKKGLTMGLAAATVVTALTMTILNYLVFIPLYAKFMNFELPKTLVITAILPFNLLKGIILSSVFFLLFLRLQTWISKQEIRFKQV